LTIIEGGIEMNVIIDEACTGCGICEDECPEVFQLDDEMASVKVDPIPENLEEKVKETAESCPVDAILIK